MDASTFIALALACSPLVHSSTARAIVATESSFNPNAIGVVDGSLQRQPRTMAEAIDTASDLRTRGRNFSVGLAQINVYNLDRFGLSLAEGFDPCKNLAAMQTLLTDCYLRATPTNADSDTEQASLRRALSCYYSGNFTTGFRDGYVSRVVSNARATTRGPP